MTDFEKLLLDEIRINRKKIEENEAKSLKRSQKIDSRFDAMSEDFTLFKGKAAGFMAVLSFVFSTTVSLATGYLTKK